MTHGLVDGGFDHQHLESMEHFKNGFNHQTFGGFTWDGLDFAVFNLAFES